MILFIDQSGQLGGAELCLADLAAGLAESRVLLFADGPFATLLGERGISFDILPISGLAHRVTKKASAAKLAASLPSLCSHILAVRRHIRRAGVVCFNTAKALVHGGAANILLNRPSIFHLHDLLDAHHFSTINIGLLVAAANRMDAVIANSQATADAFRAAGGCRPVHVIPNGFESQPFDAASPEVVCGLRNQWNPAGGPVAAVFGRLARWKGQHLLIEAAKRLPELTVWIVGEALFTDDDAAYALELRELAKPLGPRVQFTGFRTDIPELMTAADIIVHCSTSPEPFGRVIVEGMLAGKPVVASDAGGPREIICPNVTGLLVPLGDPTELAAALKSLLADPQKARSMGAAGRERALSEYALERVCADTAEVIRTVEKK